VLGERVARGVSYRRLTYVGNDGPDELRENCRVSYKAEGL